MKKLLLALLTVCLAVIQTDAQTLYAVDADIGGVVIHQESTPPAGPCGGPNPLGLAPWSYMVPPPCAGPVLGLAPVGTGAGDVALDRITDLVYVTDGFAVGEFVGDPPCGSPLPAGTMLNSYFVPPIPSAGSPGGFLGPISGMAIDPAAGILWVCDPYAVAGLAGFGAPPGTCPALLLAVPAFAPAPLPPGVPSMTDLTWDPVTGTLWITDLGTAAGAFGFVHNIMVGGALVSTLLVGAGPPGAGTGVCGTSASLTGLAYDLATPNTTSPPALYVTDAFSVVAYIDGASPGPVAFPAPPTFYTPSPCGGTYTLPTSGLAYSSGGITYGTPRIAMTIGSFGQSTSPSPTWGFEVTGTPPATTVWIVANFIPPGPGFSCPPTPSSGTLLWVDPFPPAIILPLFGAPPACTALPTPLPAGIPAGINIFVQYVAVGGGGFAVDATEGLEFTTTVP